MSFYVLPPQQTPKIEGKFHAGPLTFNYIGCVFFNLTAKDDKFVATIEGLPMTFRIHEDPNYQGADIVNLEDRKGVEFKVGRHSPSFSRIPLSMRLGGVDGLLLADIEAMVFNHLSDLGGNILSCKVSFNHGAVTDKAEEKQV